MAKSPDAFRTISEVANDLDVPQHVLRFWETKFTQIKPLKRAGGRRYYRPEDVDLLRGIRIYLYTEGFTIKGVQKIFREQGARLIVEAGRQGFAQMPRQAKRAAGAPAPTAQAPTTQAPTLPQPKAADGKGAATAKSLESIVAQLVEAKGLLQRARALRTMAPAGAAPPLQSRRA
jgi:DNA-binding transcriptional MerR regulator